MPVETGPPSRNSESPLIPGVMDASRPPSDLLQGWRIFAEKFLLFFYETLSIKLVRLYLFFFFFLSLIARSQIVNGILHVYRQIFYCFVNIRMTVLSGCVGIFRRQLKIQRTNFLGDRDFKDNFIFFYIECYTCLFIVR